MEIRIFCLRRDFEYPWVADILTFNDEFCERIAFCAFHEKIGNRIAHRCADNELRWWNAWTNGSEP
jgi:hypothetical protein